MTLLPILWSPAILAVTLGCFLTNLLGLFSGANILGWLDVLSGTLTTAIAAWITMRLGYLRWKGYPLWAAVPPVLLNAIVIGGELALVSSPFGHFSWSLYGLMFTQVFAGQFIAIFVLGLPLFKAIEKTRLFEKQG